MANHRRLLWSLGLIVSMGLMAGEASAGSITLNVDLNGTVIFSLSSVAPDQTLTIPVVAVNAALAANGSAYRFTTLGAQSNYTGAADGGSLATNFQVNTSGPGTTTDVLSIDTTQSGFLLPTGPGGTLKSSAGGSFSNATGSVTFSSDYQGVNTTPLVFALAGNNSPYSGFNLTPVGTVPSSYSLSNHFLISIAQVPGASLGGTGTAFLTTTIPEPTSVVMVMTSLPLVLIGMMQYRRSMRS